jgi:DNA-binding winged helix-turn-helix (wHTH) protein
MDHKCFVFRFGDIEVKEREFLLIKSGEAAQVEPKAFRVLLLLLRNPGRLVTKDEILSTVWTEAVSDNSLTRSIATLRRLLGDDTREPRYIATVHTVGYRFLCDVQVMTDGEGSDHTPTAVQWVDAFSNPAESSRSPSGQPSPSDLPHESRIPGLPAPGPPVSSSLPPSSPPLSPFRGWLRHSVPIAAIVLLALAAGAIWLSRREIPHLPATEQRVTSNPPDVPIFRADVSPDGKYVAYTDPTGLYLRHIATGETHPWGVPKDFIAYPNGWFPDGTHLLVTRVEGATMKRSLWKLSLLAGSPRMLMAGGFSGVVSPDGSRIAYLAVPESGSELWSMDSDGANPRKITTAKPDGHFGGRHGHQVGNGLPMSKELGLRPVPLTSNLPYRRATPAEVTHRSS